MSMTVHDQVKTLKKAALLNKQIVEVLICEIKKELFVVPWDLFALAGVVENKLVILTHQPEAGPFVKEVKLFSV